MILNKKNQGSDCALFAKGRFDTYLCVFSEQFHIRVVDVAHFIHYLAVTLLLDAVHIVDPVAQFLSQE